MKNIAHILAVGAICSGCADAPQDEVELDLTARGTSVESLELGETLTITLSRAEVAFGPLYLCAGSQAGELCDTARLEWTDSAVVDLLDARPKPIGTLVGVTGPIRSYMFDYGISSLLTQERPVVSDAAQELGGLSLSGEGEARLAGTLVPFSFEVIIAPGEETEVGVPVVRKSTSESFSFDVTTTSNTFEVTFDVANWLSGIDASDFEDALDEGDCLPGQDEQCEKLDFDAESSFSHSVGQMMVAGQGPEFSLD